MPRKKVEPTMKVSDRTWMSLAQAAEHIGFSIEFFNANVRPHIKYLPWGDKDNSPVSFKREHIDDYLDSRLVDYYTEAPKQEKSKNQK